eukprot:gene2435-2386_t
MNQRLHGPAADYVHNLNREALKELIAPVVREHQSELDTDAEQDEFNTTDAVDPQQLTVTVIRALLRDGWLEQYPDRNGLVTAFRFSRPGKLFAEAFWALHRPSRSRQRNMRGCRNALEAALSERGDAHDLVDAYEYAEKVIEDLTEGIDYLQERIRHLMQEATRVEEQLQDIAQWAVKEHTGSSVFEWLLDRIDDIVNAACDTKQPTFVRAMDTYIRRITGLVQQSMMLRTGQNRHAYLNAISKLAERDKAGQDKLLQTIGEQISCVEIRLLDPSSFNLTTELREKLAKTTVTMERFREIATRLLSYGVLVRDEDRTEQALYDETRQVESLLSEYFEVVGMYLHHDVNAQFFRLYAPGAVVDGIREDTFSPVPSLKARVSTDFVAAAIALRFLYQEKLNQGLIDTQAEALISLRPGNFEMGDMTLLTGETGSGKSTMLDALQTVMTAANKGVMNYNPGQDEVTQGQRRGKTKRTLESYVVGAEYNNFSRKDGAQGYMAAVFRQSKGEEHLKPFTALVAASARVEGSTADTRQAKLESLQLVIVDDAALTFEDFMKDVETNECIAVDRIARHLQSKFSRVHDFNEKKMDYLCALYGRFRGKSSVTKDEATNAAKAWVQSIAYRPIGSVHELVRDEILDFDERQLQQDIERISGLMKQVSNLRQEGAHEAHVMQGMLVAKLQLSNDDVAIEAKKKLISKADEAIKEENGKITSWNARLAVIDDQRVQLTAQLQGIPVHNQKMELDSNLAKATATARASLDELSLSLIAAGLLEQRSKELISKPIPESFKELQKAVDRVAKAYGQVDFPRLAACRDSVAEATKGEELNVWKLYSVVSALSGINQGIDNLHVALVGTDESVAMAISAEATTVSQIKTKADDKVRDLGSQKSRLLQGKVSYPPYVQRGLDLLHEQFRDANAQVLCDLVEPKSETWQTAIEGYLGNARFNIIVSPEWERRCVDFLKSRAISAKIIQGAMCLKDAEGKVLPTDSIVRELTAANPIAWAYLVEQYGGVVKVADTEALRYTKRGITLDGIGSGSRSMFTAEKKSNNVFGIKARLKAPRFDANALRDAANLIEKTRASLETLDITELNVMQETLLRIQGEIRDFYLSISAANQRVGEHNSAMANAEAAIKGIQASKQDHLKALEGQIQKLKKLVASNPAFTYPALVAGIDERLSQAPVTLEVAKNALGDLAVKPGNLLVDAREALTHYNSQAKPDERFVVTLTAWHDTQSFDATYYALIEMAKVVVKTLDGLRSIGLYNNSRELDKAEKSFHDVFTKQFCVEIKSRVDDGIRTLRQMNGELKNLKFGSDSFSIDWSRWEPEFEDYLSFFGEVTKLADSAESMDLFGDGTFSERHANIRDKLVKLLLDDNQERATKDLMRIADYRNYRHYDIINDTSSGGRVKLSEWGTGSGGQLETPAYIVRAAVVTNRLKLFEKSPSLKLLVNDESFAKMDEPRARADEFNREYSFTRLAVPNGELDFISECDERIFKEDKMRDLWERQRVLAREKAKQLFDLANPEEDTDDAPDEVAVAVRKATGRMARQKTALERWREALSLHLDATDEVKKVAGDYCIDMPDREMAEVVERLNGLRALADTHMLLREVSAKLFWGMSKVLDNRTGLVAALLGVEECPFSESPVQLQVYLPIGGFSGVLFVENLMSFEQAMRSKGQAFSKLALVYASGFKGSAARLRTPEAVSLILAAMRNNFPVMQAWEPGYQPMLQSLLAGQGHSPEASDKKGQRPMVAFGCPYADAHLVPALTAHGRFVDQEQFTL